MKPVVCLIGMIVIFMTMSMTSEAQKRVALVIGNSSYDRSPDLRNPVNDARSIAKRLKELGFELSGGTHYENITRVGMARLVRRFTNEVGRYDTALVF